MKDTFLTRLVNAAEKCRILFSWRMRKCIANGWLPLSFLISFDSQALRLMISDNAMSAYAEGIFKAEDFKGLSLRRVHTLLSDQTLKFLRRRYCNARELITLESRAIELITSDDAQTYYIRKYLSPFQLMAHRFEERELIVNLLTQNNEAFAKHTKLNIRFDRELPNGISYYTNLQHNGKTYVLVRGHDDNNAFNGTYHLEFLYKSGYDVIVVNGNGKTALPRAFIQSYLTQLHKENPRIDISGIIVSAHGSNEKPHRIGFADNKTIITKLLVQSIRAAFNISKPINLFVDSCFSGQALTDIKASYALPEGSKMYSSANSRVESCHFSMKSIIKLPEMTFLFPSPCYRLFRGSVAINPYSQAATVPLAELEEDLDSFLAQDSTALTNHEIYRSCVDTEEQLLHVMSNLNFFRDNVHQEEHLRFLLSDEAMILEQKKLMTLESLFKIAQLDQPLLRLRTLSSAVMIELFEIDHSLDANVVGQYDLKELLRAERHCNRSTINTAAQIASGQITMAELQAQAM